MKNIMEIHSGIKKHEALLGVEYHEISSDFIYKLRQTHPSPDHTFGMLPDFTLNEKGNIVSAMPHHWFVGLCEEEKDEKYTYLNFSTLDNLLQEEISNAGYEDLFNKDLDFKYFLRSFVPDNDDDDRNFIIPKVNYLIIEIEYIVSCGFEDYDCEINLNIIGYLDMQYKRHNFKDNEHKSG